MINEANDPSATAADDHESGDESIGSDGATSSVDSEASTPPPPPPPHEFENLRTTTITAMAIHREAWASRG